MTSPPEALLQCWRDIAGDGFDHTATILVERHAEPHRRYHTAEHVMWVLRHVDVLVAAEQPPAGQMIDIDAVRAAALFHDIVYDPRSTTNEADSAEIAVEALRAVGWSTDRLALVRALVLATAGHQAATFAAGVLLDADLAVLGAEPSAYREYAAGVRFEYGFVDDAEWRTGRARLLRSFLDRPRILATATMAAEREQQARANLTGELEELVSDAHR